MNHDVPGAGALDYHICHYGASRLPFRGPRQHPQGRYIVALGGTETFGRFVPRPWPDRLAALTGLQTINLGCANAGIDSFLGDPDVLAMLGGAAVTVVQVMGAQNLSNSYYSVHPRRNDRFLGPTPLMRQVFPDLDFTEFHFTRHLLSALADRAPDRFAVLQAELRRVWLTRMRDLLARAGGRRIVLWMADHPPAPSDMTADIRSGMPPAPPFAPPPAPPPAHRPVTDHGPPDPRRTCSGRPDIPSAWPDPKPFAPAMIPACAAAAAPAFSPWGVDAALLAALEPACDRIVLAVPSPRARALGTHGMVYAGLDAALAQGLPGSVAHDEAAEAIARAVQDLIT